MAESSPKIACPNCGKEYRWKPQLAGKKTQCSGCQQKLRIPARPTDPVEAIGGLLKDQSHESEGAYELALPDDHDDAHMDANAGRKGGQRSTPPPAPRNLTNCPACNSKLKPGAVICINCGFHVAEGKKISTDVAKGAVAVEEGDAPAAAMPDLGAYAKASQRVALDLEAEAARNAAPNPLMNIWLPVLFIVAGIAMTFMQRMLNPISDYALAEAAVVTGIQLAISVPFMLFVAVMVSKLMDTSFGPLGVGVLKLTAIAMGPLPVADYLLSYVPLFGFVSFFIVIAVYVIVCGPFLYWFFDLDFNEIFATLALIIVLRMLLTLFLIVFLLGLIF